MLWCSLRFTHKKYAWFVFVYRRGRVLLWCVCLLVYSGAQHFAISYVFTFLFPCCDVRYVFRIKPMFDSSLPPVLCRTYLCYLWLFEHSDVQHVVKMWVTRYVSYKRLELLTHRVHLGSLQVCGGVRVGFFIVFLYVFALFVLDMCLMCLMLPVSMDWSFMINTSAFSNVYFKMLWTVWIVVAVILNNLDWHLHGPQFTSLLKFLISFQPWLVSL